MCMCVCQRTHAHMSPTLRYTACGGTPKHNPQPTTDNQQPTTNNQQPTTDNQQPTTNNQQPTTNNQQPTTTNNQQSTTNNRQPRTKNHVPMIKNHEARIKNREPRTNNQDPRTKQQERSVMNKDHESRIKNEERRTKNQEIKSKNRGARRTKQRHTSGRVSACCAAPVCSHKKQKYRAAEQKQIALAQLTQAATPQTAHARSKRHSSALARHLGLLLLGASFCAARC